LTRGKIISKVNNFHLSIFNYAWSNVLYTI
jgi:hypothetical protein